MQKPKIKIFGERNSGTNYLSKLISVNFDCELLPGTVPGFIHRVTKKIPKTDFLKEVYFDLTTYKNLGWKHREVSDFVRILNTNLEQHLFFITITKNPYSWLLSLYKRPYHRKGKSDISFEEFLKNRWKVLQRETASGQWYDNPIEMWNRKNQSYIQLNNFFKSYTVRYETIVIEPINEIKNISKKLEIDLKVDKPKNFDRSTKPKDKNKDSKFYKDYYGNMKWKEKLSDNHIKIINQSLDPSIMEHFNYETLKTS